MQNFSHAWTTFVQSLPFLSPVDFLSELLPKAGGCVSACMFFFFLWRGVMLWTLRLHWPSVNLNHSSPTPSRCYLPFKKFDTDWCRYWIAHRASHQYQGGIMAQWPSKIHILCMSGPYSCQNLLSSSHRGTERIAKIEQRIVGIESHLLLSRSKIDFRHLADSFALTVVHPQSYRAVALHRRLTTGARKQRQGNHSRDSLRS